MKDYTCLYCGIKLRGNFKGKNSVIKHRGGMLHERCEYYYKEQMRKKWKEPESWNRYIRERAAADPDKYRKYHREYMRGYRQKVKVNT